MKQQITLKYYRNKNNNMTIKDIVFNTNDVRWENHIDCNYFTSWDPYIRIFPKHGWKIHISCFFDNYNEILDKVANFCLNNSISFKFINNRSILNYSISKNANRSESGKFITLYPHNQAEFVDTIRKLYPILKFYGGPYILSDKRYLDCKVLYYRYGSFTIENTMIFKDGIVQDERLPYYVENPYICDPLHENILEGDQDTYLTSHYDEIEPLLYSNGGGIYNAKYVLTDEEVILKEARPYIGISEQNTCIQSRIRESKFLKVLSSTNSCPQLLDEFYEWEHFFICVKKIDGISLHEYIEKNALLFVDPNDKEEVKNRSRVLKDIVISILETVQEIHEKSIVINDISVSNIMLNRNNDVFFVDFEDAYFLNEMWGKKFQIKHQFIEDKRIQNLDDFKKDFHKIGYIIMSLFSNSNYLLKYNHNGGCSLSNFKVFCERYNLSYDILKVVDHLISGDYESIDQVINLLRNNRDVKVNDECDINSLLERYSNEKSLVYCNYFSTAILLDLMNVKKFTIVNHLYNQLNNSVENYRNKNVAALIEGLEINNLKFDIYHGQLLSILVHLFLYSRTKKEEYLQIIKTNLLTIIEKDLNEQNFLVEDNLAIPYMTHTAGLASIIIAFLNFEKNVKLQGYLDAILKSLSNSFTKDMSYINGLAGLTDVFLTAYAFTQNKDWLNQSISNLKVMLLCEENIDPELDNDTFEEGSAGRYFVYNKAYQLINK